VKMSQTPAADNVSAAPRRFVTRGHFSATWKLCAANLFCRNRCRAAYNNSVQSFVTISVSPSTSWSCHKLPKIVTTRQCGCRELNSVIAESRVQWVMGKMRG